MYYFANKINIELHNVFLKKNVTPSFSNNFRPVNSLIYYRVGGQCFEFGENRVIAKAGDVLIMPYGLKYKNRILSKDTEYYQIDFSVYSDSAPFAIVDVPTVVPPPFGESVYGFFGDIYAKYHSANVGNELDTIADVLKMLSFLQKREIFGINKAGRKSQLTDAMEYINNYYNENISVTEIAESLYISVSALEKSFKAVLGVSPTQYRNNVRIERAKQFLAEGNTIEAVAAKTGFSDRYYFSKMFKRITGISPATFIKNCEL